MMSEKEWMRTRKKLRPKECRLGTDLKWQRVALVKSARKRGLE